MNSSEILMNLIKYKTITPNECGIYNYIKSILSNFNFLDLNANLDETKNIFFYKTPSCMDFFEAKKKFKHICFAGHVDVVPPGNNWECDPFIPTIKIENDKHYIYGRGTQDMKGGIAAFLDSIINYSKQKHNFIISILLTSDEEGVGTYGTKYAINELEKMNMLPDYAIVAEPTCSNFLGDFIKIGRRGSINGKITINGVQGHAAYPNKCINPVELLGSKLGDIAGYEFDLGDLHFAPSKMVITDIRGGIETSNVTPSTLKIMFNVRNSTNTNIDNIREYINKILKDIDFSCELTQSAFPFITQDSILIQKLQNSIVKVTKKIPKLSTDGGTSDARFFALKKIDVVELGVINDRIHAVNERVCIHDLNQLSLIFNEFLNLLNEI